MLSAGSKSGRTIAGDGAHGARAGAGGPSVELPALEGYYDIIRRADALVFFDDAQFTKNDGRNRNRIKTRSGLPWISVPVGANIPAASATPRSTTTAGRRDTAARLRTLCAEFL